ncbi:MAG TPA: hypothetical protein VGK42_06735 [Candidatus Dormibacteraeota bacterium]|jgi:hypothetical protein
MKVSQTGFDSPAIASRMNGHPKLHSRPQSRPNEPAFLYLPVGVSVEECGGIPRFQMAVLTMEIGAQPRECVRMAARGPLPAAFIKIPAPDQRLNQGTR